MLVGEERGNLPRHSSSADVVVEEPHLRLDRLARRGHEVRPAAPLRRPRGRPHVEALVGLLVDQPPLLVVFQ